MSSLIRRIAAVLCLCAFASLASAADLKMTTRNTMAGNTSEGTTYIKGPRQRTEMQMGPFHQVTITQCDKRQTITVSDACRTYMVAPMDNDDAAAPRSSNNMRSDSGASDSASRKGGVLTVNSTSTPTGETQRMFGYTARRIKTSMSMTSSPDACNQTNMKMESDGWYADFSANGLTCSATPRPGNMGRMRHDCQDRVRMTGGGMRNLGHPMKVTTTMTDAQGRSFVTSQETTEISRETLDPALFDVPSNYRQVTDYQGLMCQAAMTGGSGASGMGRDDNPPPPARDDQADQGRHRRRGGRGALCVAPVVSQTNTSFDNEAWRDMLISELQTLRVESVKLDSQNQFDLRAEAADKGCHYVLYTDVTDMRRPSSRRRAGGAPGANVSTRYQSSVHEQLQATDEFVPRLDKGVTGEGANMDGGGRSALRIEAQDVATELGKPR